MTVTALIAIMMFLALLGIVGLIIGTAINGERVQRILTFEYRLNNIENYLERLDQDVALNLADEAGLGMGFPSGMNVQTISMDEIVEKMKNSGRVESDASDEEVLRAFFQSLLESQQGSSEDDDEDESTDKWK